METDEKKFAFVMGRMSPAKEGIAVKQLWQLDSVEDVHCTFGKFDFIVKVQFDSFENLYNSYMQLKQIPELKLQKILIATRDCEVNEGMRSVAMPKTAA